MADAQHTVSRHLRTLFEIGAVAGLSDGQLLDLFVTRGNETAFAALIERHGPMVQRVCHEVLGDHHDTQDAFQATFLVLAQQARSIRRRDSLASWLYGVALRIGACARSASARRKRHERNWAALRVTETGGKDEKNREGVEPVLHVELGRLPERFRAPLVLCCLEGRTYEEAAQILLCPVGTIKSRLATARERLRRRMERMALVPLAGQSGIAFHLTAATPVAVPAQLVNMTIQEVVRNRVAGVATTAVAKLAQGVLKSMLLNRLSAILGILVVSAILATGAISLARSAGEAEAVADANVTAPPNAGEPPRAASEHHTPKSQAVPRTTDPIVLTGRVVDERGRPVSKARVRVRRFRGSLRPLRTAAKVVDVWEVRTDPEGRYRIDGVNGIQGDDSQHLALDVNAPEYVEFFQPHFSDLLGLAVRQGNLADIRLKRGVAVIGRCVGPDGKPVAGAKIHSAYADEPMSGLGRTQTTDATGHFRLTLPDGRNAELIVYPQSLAPRRVRVPVGGGDLGDISLETGIEIDGSLEDARGIVFVGTGSAEGLTAEAFVPGSPPLPDKLIAFESTDRGEFGWFPIVLAAKTDRDGRFQIPSVKGAFKIWAAQAHEAGRDDSGPVSCDGPVPAVLPRIMHFDPQSGRVRQELVLGTRTEVTIRGTITGPDGKPANSVGLYLLVAIEDGNRLTPLRWTATDANGRYALTGIPRGLTQAQLSVFAEPPDQHSFGGIVASGRFQREASAASVRFERLEQDQDPLDFRLQFEPLPPPGPPKDGPADGKE
ncbi:RNA polymerase sigma factor, sigma-70 family [Singulisphaera sp. GP187]|uniref:sigma-70 family RNA polymerase sigma factor n=1 Tax=Singulisphaera sp. GP187 TaxID=1882752 RepID=UPI000926D47F|nr:sigma-70 family RNA polymerase sigma factor [Singulisphaera sp. GP187]SIN79642.1 RNA polymerase sigma factor, sigma-70 family [Singulisphaera sp. GP187]